MPSRTLRYATLAPKSRDVDVAEEGDVAISISVVLLLTILTVVFVRNSALKASHAIVCILLGFYLASTSMAPTINDGLTTTADIVSSIDP